MAVIEITAEGLRELDFVPSLPCEYPTCDAPAVVVWRCVKFGCGAQLMCSGCSAIGRQEFADVVNSGRAVRCKHCGDESKNFDEIVKIVEL